MRRMSPGVSAFTLVEMVTSLAILSVLVVACGAMVQMATRATTDATTLTAAQFQAADAASQIADDLNVATNFTQRTARSATFTVPDRLNAGAPQTVTYSWSGVPDAPLLRTFNNGPATAILPKANNVNFAYSTRVVGPAPGPTEQVLFSHITTTGSVNNFDITNTKNCAQMFYPSVSGAGTYSITRVRVLMKTGSQNAVMKVQVRYGGLLAASPSTPVYAETNVYVSGFSSDYEWIDIPFTGLSGLNPNDRVAIVIGYASGATNVATVQYDTNLLAILTNAHWSTSTNSGSSWALASNLSAAKMAVYGTVP